MTLDEPMPALYLVVDQLSVGISGPEPVTPTTYRLDVLDHDQQRGLTWSSRERAIAKALCKHVLAEISKEEA